MQAKRDILLAFLFLTCSCLRNRNGTEREKIVQDKMGNMWAKPNAVSSAKDGATKVPVHSDT